MGQVSFKSGMEERGSDVSCLLQMMNEPEVNRSSF